MQTLNRFQVEEKASNTQIVNQIFGVAFTAKPGLGSIETMDLRVAPVDFIQCLIDAARAGTLLPNWL